ncbi:hypothetical protein [Nesterenkonia sandarakina]|uniref:Transcriptional regulator, AbiEi antitoxin, Type IV TA system n=1 Tax=Nesterenkonia sandarakina TaxID=272918 RepID=A0A2T0YRD9_9MICC|nr:hypothetical protein [Nesterenkonia sandarakina]PRZ18111.1 Transcriptional regulator, AbiEi antitoxin, Type IV TA system [Nesterenkonia sandarakina]
MDLATSTPLPAQITLIRSQELPDGIHSSTRLKSAVNAGAMLRLRRGIYVHTADWLAAPPWERHLAAAGAAAMTRSTPVFCRETGLALHGVPLIRTPDAVQLRTRHQGGTRLVPPPVMTGSTDPRAVVRRHLAPDDDERAASASVVALRGIPTRLHEHVAPPRTSRPAFRLLVGAGHEPPHQDLAMGFRDHWPGSVTHCAVEEFGLLLADTVPRMETGAGVVVLDAVLGARVRSGARLSLEVLEAWGGFIHSQRRLGRWRACLELADARSESAGESLSRVRMLDLGFEPPQLQVSFDLGGTVARVDFYWPGVGVVGEFDGKLKYTRGSGLSGASAEDVVWEEKLREDALRARGLKVVRWVWDDLQRPGALAARLHTAGVPLAKKS